MEICNTLEQYEKVISLLPKDCIIGFVPTMGALHPGHISLVKEAKKYSNTVVVSIFVNPVQFNNPDDLASYPRTVEADCKMLRDAGADIVLIPSEKEIYPTSKSREFDLGGLDTTGEGARRPGHFNGVARVVTRLFEIVKPQFAFFGEKDFQQLAVIKHFTKELNYPVQIISCPTIREEDGVAMSSRNMLLSMEHRKAAPRIHSTLVKAKEMCSKKENPDIFEITEWVKNQINTNPLLKAEYAEAVEPMTMKVVTDWNSSPDIQLCVAVFADNVRLIDNIKLK